MTAKRYFTKSRFKLGLECPTKLFYTGKSSYGNTKLDDPFLSALADGGYQVGELAKQYFPEGIEIDGLDHQQSLETSCELLSQDKVTLFEPAISAGNLFIRVDILVKDGNHFDLIEVKAKSFDASDENVFIGKRGGIKSDWKPYLMDIAFQKYVIQEAFPNATIDCYLMLIDKHALSKTDGLNQKFRLVRDEQNHKGIQVSSHLSGEDLQVPLLIQVPVNDAVTAIENTDEFPGRTFIDQIHFLANAYQADTRISTSIGKKCHSCEFTCTGTGTNSELEQKSGFKECWHSQLNWQEEDFESPTVLDIWNFRKAEQLIEAGKIKLTDLDESDISPEDEATEYLTTKQRQWLQVEKVQENDSSPYFDKDGFLTEYSSWTYPFHFIDFETTMVALPFTKGRHPYEGIAFQFSHHVMYEDGTVEHAGEFLNTERGHFPNYDFLRALQEQLSQDDGTIFRYAPHENTFLNLIYHQLRLDPVPPPDVTELMEFIQTITHSSDKSLEKWTGARDMVDMFALVKRYYYSPMMGGSNSIKYVLPSILNSSDFLKEKYSRPIYGSATGIPSSNFKDWCWIETEGEKVIDPYKRLPKLFADLPETGIELLSDSDELNNGGMALTAYAKLQFEDMSEYERNELRQGLLKYCETDTFAMVCIMEAWLNSPQSIKHESVIN